MLAATLERRAGKTPREDLRNPLEFEAMCGSGERAAEVSGSIKNRLNENGSSKTHTQPARYAPASPHGVGSGTAHGPSTSIDLKSAGPTISRYSMSGE